MVTFLKAAFEEHLLTLIPDEKSPLHEAARYALAGGGKRVRPLLCLATAEALGVPLEKSLTPAAALELIHTYSLIHDDLPCMDDDDLRRGRPTLHKLYSEGHAVLTGDFLLTFAFELLATAPHLTDGQRVALVASLAQAAGGAGMVGGQADDISADNPTPNQLDSIHRRKTGALFVASVEFGALLGGLEATTMRPFGEKIGLLFQVVDDLLDNDGHVKLIGREMTLQTAQTLCDEAIAALPFAAPTLEGLTRQILEQVTATR